MAYSVVAHWVNYIISSCIQYSSVPACAYMEMGPEATFSISCSWSWICTCAPWQHALANISCSAVLHYVLISIGHIGRGKSDHACNLTDHARHQMNHQGSQLAQYPLWLYLIGWLTHLYKYVRWGFEYAGFTYRSRITIRQRLQLLLSPMHWSPPLPHWTPFWSPLHGAQWQDIRASSTYIRTNCNTGYSSYQT